MKAILVINVQNDHLEGAMPVPGAKEILDPLNKALEAFPLALASKKWHPANHQSFAESHPGKKPGDQVSIHRATWLLQPSHCIAGSPGSHFPDGLKQELFEVVFRTCFYPDFEDGGAFSDKNNENSTALDAYLLGRGVQHLYLTGLPLETAVLDSGLNAAHCIRHTYVIEDLVRPHDPSEADNAWAALHEAGVKRITLAEALAAL